MITILHVIDTTGPGGAESIFIELADRMRSRGYRCIPLIRGPGWVKEELERRGLKPELIDAKGSFNLGYLGKLLKLIRRERVDLIQSHLLGSNVYSALAGWLTRTPVVGTFHGMVDISPDERLRGLKRAVMALGLDKCVLVSESLKAAVEAAGLLRSGDTRVIYNGVDTQKYESPVRGTLRDDLGLPPNARLALSVGNIRPAKGYDILIRAAAQLMLKHPSLHFVVAGHIKQDLMRELEQLMQTLYVRERMHFVGFVQNTPALLAEADLFVLSSTSEGFSLSTVEALASGLPAVLTRCGGPEEIAVHGEHALMAPVGDSNALAEAIDSLLADRQLAETLAREGQAMVKERFSIAAMLAAYDSVYRELISVNQR
jgi:glycosyltransferase involved in cell wall biosynthesis